VGCQFLNYIILFSGILYICLRIFRGSEWEGSEIGRPSHLPPYYYIVCNNISVPEGYIKGDTFSFILSNIRRLIRILIDTGSLREEPSIGGVQN
jgi:hypothetical protein